MKIGLIGWFGVGAYCDDIINLATRSIFNSLQNGLQYDSNVMWRCQQDGKVNIEYLNSFDLLILCGGSLLGKCTFAPINSIETWADKLTAPLCIFGTAYRYEQKEEPLSEIRRQRMNRLFDLAKVIMLRGQRSVYWCEINRIDTNKVTALGDPVLAWRSKLETEPREVIGGNVRNMPNNEVQYTTNEIVQKKMAHFYDWLMKETGLPLELYCFRKARYDSDIVGAEKTRAYMKNKEDVTVRTFSFAQEAFTSIDVSFWCGQRLHPSIYAAAVGIPFVGIDSQFQKEWDFMTSIHSNNFIFIFNGLKTLIAQFNRVMKNDYMNYVNNQVQLTREKIRAAAAKMLEVGEE